MKRRLLYLAALCAAAVLALAPEALAQTDGLNCGDFANQETAQAILDANPGDPYGFDVDGDGVACEDPGTGTAEDGTLAPFGQYAQYQYSGAAPAQLAETGGPSLLITAVAATLLLGAGAVMAVFAVARRRSPRVAALAGAHRSFVNVGANGKRLVVIALAAVLATLLAIVLGSGVVGPAKPASAQGAGPLYLTTAVYPRPTYAIPVGTRMDFLITEANVSAGGRTARNVTVYDQLPAGVTFVSAKSSQGSCFPMADEPTINCSLGTIRPGGVVHINIVVDAASRGTHTNVVSDQLGNQASATFTIIRPLYQ